MEPIITRNGNVMHGAPCFAGTRVTVQTFFDHIEAGYTVAQFLNCFPTVREEQITRLISKMRDGAERSAVSVSA